MWIIQKFYSLLKQWVKQSNNNQNKIMAAIDTLTASVLALNTSVLALTSAVDTATTAPAALEAAIDTQTARLVPTPVV